MIGKNDDLVVGLSTSNQGDAHQVAGTSDGNNSKKYAPANNNRTAYVTPPRHQKDETQRSFTPPCCLILNASSAQKTV